jgi:hypothetical protein
LLLLYETRFTRAKVESAFPASPFVIPSEVEESLDTFFFFSEASSAIRSFRLARLCAKFQNTRHIMQQIIFILLTSLLTGRLLADQSRAEDELTTLKRDYADVLALQGTSKGEILAIARILRANPKVAIDQTAASGEYCFNSGLGTMVHFATQPERTPEGVVYEFDASGLIAAGLDPSRLQQLPERGRMTPGVWYFLPKGQQDPHHAHAMPNPVLATAVNIK